MIFSHSTTNETFTLLQDAKPFTKDAKKKVVVKGFTTTKRTLSTY